MVLIAGLVGTVTAIWLYNNFVSWLAFLNATLPPIGAIIILDYFLRKNAYEVDSKFKLRKVNWFALAGVVVGALVGNYVPWGISAINAMIAACIVYFVGTKLFYKD
jgi:cytosine permease